MSTALVKEKQAQVEKLVEEMEHLLANQSLETQSKAAQGSSINSLKALELCNDLHKSIAQDDPSAGELSIDQMQQINEEIKNSPRQSNVAKTGKGMLDMRRPMTSQTGINVQELQHVN